MTNTNPILLFGDYGTEVYKLSELYDPKKDKYQQETATAPIDGRNYFLPRWRERVLEFVAVNKDDLDLDSDGKFTTPGQYWYDTGKETQSGRYVPSKTSLVIVDTVDDTRWGSYTLLVVDSVDELTFETVLKPINFTGGVDNATRAVDYANDQLYLYVEDVEVNGERYQRLNPDRKLMLYGHNTIRYCIKKTFNGISTIISTNSVSGGHADQMEFSDYQSLGNSLGGSLVAVTSKDIYLTLVGKNVRYHDIDGKTIISKITGTFDDADESLFKDLLACYLRGDKVLVYDDKINNLVDIQLAESCYKRTSVPDLVQGDRVVFEVYESDNSSDDGRERKNRLIMSVNLQVAAGKSLKAEDIATGQIVKFDVRLDGYNVPGDVWEIAANTPIKNIKTTPYLIMDDGSEVDISDLRDKSYFEFGIEQIENAPIGRTFDTVFKFFPNRLHGVPNSNNLDNRYEAVVLDQTVDEETGMLIQRPSPYVRYFVMVEGEYKLADNNGYPSAFTPDVEYFTTSSRMTWDGNVSRPSTDVLVVRKRVKVVSANQEALRKISVIPVWDNEHEKYDLKFMVYTTDGAHPRLITSLPSDDGQVIVSGLDDSLDMNPNSDQPKLFKLELIYKPNIASAAWTTAAKTVALALRHFTSDTAGAEKWLIGYTDAGESIANLLDTAQPAYGRENMGSGSRRPYILCEVTANAETGDTGASYRIPTNAQLGFQDMTQSGGINMFVEMFYKRALTKDDIGWSDNDGEVIEPTHFCVRTIDNVSSTDYIPISDGHMSYGVPFRCPELPVPDAGGMAQVIMEFCYKNSDGKFKHLLAVPVEIRREQEA